MATNDTMTLKGSVGARGKNKQPDVLIVQRLLNMAWMEYPAYAAAMTDPVPEDGKCDDAMIEAIRRFQFYAMNWVASGCDGRVDVNGKTWKALNGNTSILQQVRSMTTAETMRVFEAFRQGEIKGSLGSGDLSIAGYGCALCSLTMAATCIGARTQDWSDYPNVTPRKLTPTISNQIIKKGKGFSGSLLIIGKAAECLGMIYDGTHMSDPCALSYVDEHLALGLPVMLNVDYKSKAVMVPDMTDPEPDPAKKRKIPKRDEEGNIVYSSTFEPDHWVLLVGRSGKSYVALDPSYGAPIHFTSDLKTQRELNPRARATGFGDPFLVGEHGFYGKAPDDYTVRRFGLLYPS